VKMLCRAPFFQQGAVVPIHGQQQIEFLKVTLDNGSGPQMRQVITALTRMRLAAFIGGRVRVEVVRSCRIDFDFVQKMVLGELLRKDRLRRRTSTNVAHANKQNFEISGVHFVLCFGCTGER